MLLGELSIAHMVSVALDPNIVNDDGPSAPATGSGPGTLFQATGLDLVPEGKGYCEGMVNPTYDMSLDNFAFDNALTVPSGPAYQSSFAGPVDAASVVIVQVTDDIAHMVIIALPLNIDNDPKLLPRWDPGLGLDPSWSSSDDPGPPSRTRRRPWRCRCRPRSWPMIVGVT